MISQDREKILVEIEKRFKNNYAGIAVYQTVEQILNSLVGEDERPKLEPRVCSECGAKWSDETAAETTKRMIEEFIDDHPFMHSIHKAGLTNCIRWLDKEGK